MREAASEPAAVYATADLKRPARQRHQLQHPPRRSDRISARIGQARGSVSSSGEMKR